MDGEAQGGSGCSIRVSRVVNLLERKEVFEMKRVLNLLIVLFALVLSVQTLATIITSETSNSDTATTNPKFPYSDIGGSSTGPEIKLFATEINPDLNEEVTLRLECSAGGRLVAEKATIRFKIPGGMEVISGDTLWSGAAGMGETVVREIVIKPVERERFLCYGYFDVKGYYPSGEKKYSVSGFGDKVIQIKVKGAPDPRVKMIKKAIEELKKELKEVEEGKVPKDTSGHPPGVRWGPPLLNVAPRLDAKGREIAPCDSVDQDSLSALLDSLQQEYDSLSHELWRKKNPGIGIPLKLNESSPKGSYDIQAVVNHPSAVEFWFEDQWGNVVDMDSWWVTPSSLGSVEENLTTHKAILNAGSSAGTGEIWASYGGQDYYGGSVRVIANFSLHGIYQYVYGKEPGDTRVCPNTQIRLIDGDTGEQVEVTYTDNTGHWTFENVNICYVQVWIISQAEAADVFVNDDHDHVWGRYVYCENVAQLIPDNDILDWGTWTCESDWNISSALNICRTTGIARDFATIGTPPDRVEVEWGPEIHGSGYRLSDRVITIRSDAGDEDQWDENAIYHEYGHYVMFGYGGSSIPPHIGGTHYWSKPQHPNSAYCEGWANFFSMAVNDDPRFLNRMANEGFYYCMNGENCCDTLMPVGEPCPSGRTEPCPLPGDSIEAQVTALLWDMYDSDDDVDDCNNDVGVSEIYLTIWSVLDVFKVNDHNPYNIRQFCTGWSDIYGASEAMRNLWAAHGIPEYPYILSDVNCDRQAYTVDDAVFWIEYIKEHIDIADDDCPDEEQEIASDLNGDGHYWTIADLCYLVNIINGSVGPPQEEKSSGSLAMMGDPSDKDSLIVEGATGSPGDTGIVLPVSLVNSFVLAAFDFQIAFDSSILTATRVERTTRTDSFKIFSVRIDSGVVNVLGIYEDWSSDTCYPMPIGSGPIAKVVFTISPDAPLGDYPVVFDQSRYYFNDLASYDNSPVDRPTLVDGVFEVVEETEVETHPQNQQPITFSLGQNYPDPFNSATNIEYCISHRVYVKMEVYNLLGQRVVTLVDGQKEAGIHRVTWDGRSAKGKSLASGIYFYRIRAGDYIFTRKMLLLR